MSRKKSQTQDLFSMMEIENDNVVENSQEEKIMDCEKNIEKHFILC